MNNELIKDNTLRSKYTLIAFAVLAGVDVLSVGLTFYQNSVFKSYEQNDYSEEFITNLDYATIFLGILQFICIITLIVLFIKWFRRAYGNLIRLEIRMDYTENGAVWGYFIPFINWVRPIKTMKEIYIKTQKAIKEYDSTLVLDQNLNFIAIWWIIYIANGVVGNFASKAMNRAITIDEFIDANNIYIISDLVDILSIALAVIVIQKITKFELSLKKVDKSLSLIDQIGTE
ncbi:DUF4328 domain-containing protein [Jejuia spongiicola]|uniref:DUF4328 domain-containing protein n=1 Tax=Jejuia spongiicola TaxID=2942207 RepID=A0ABT0QF25_9FLAO|nr:DUF4328 domain-containing protein [Jejuia spongiicola]MCL6294565.1 DUF4328 domain-containing protein [Jejuia spongiicola]